MTRQHLTSRAVSLGLTALMAAFCLTLAFTQSASPFSG